MLWVYFLIRYIQYAIFYKIFQEIKSDYNLFLIDRYNLLILPELKIRSPEAFSSELNPTIWPEWVHYVVPFGRAGHDLDANEYSERAYVKELRFLPVMRSKFRAFSQLSIRSRYLSDYILPYFIALSPLIYAFCFSGSALYLL